jgi:hypothetical protein
MGWRGKMNWFRTILDGVAMSAAFNSYVAVFWLLEPHSFIGMFPKELQKKARERTREEKRHTLIMCCTLYPALLVWIVLSTWQAGVVGFWNMFWTAYVEMMFVSLGDLFFLDYLLLKKTGTRLHADGVKGDSFYEPKNELLKLGLPEHLILWSVVFCPVVGTITAGVGILLR